MGCSGVAWPQRIVPARAVEGVVAYAGPYRFHGDRVIHHVVLSLFPYWVGSDQQRRVELAGDRLS
jgi:hypothetical protein